MQKVQPIPVKSPAPLIELDPAKILGGLADGTSKSAAGSKALGMKAAR